MFRRTGFAKPGKILILAGKISGIIIFLAGEDVYG